MSSERIGSSFESVLEEEGIRDDVDAVAQNRVCAWQIQRAEKEAHVPAESGDSSLLRNCSSHNV